jgi:sugar phosphate isomerase/epimerase
MPSLKGSFPFRLGTTSYIVPDDILPNVEFLAPQVDDVQLVLFESDEISNLPDRGTLAALIEQAGRHDLSYTVHLPLDARLGAADEDRRVASVGKCRRVIELTRALEPAAWNLHLDGRLRGSPPAADLEDWRGALARSLDDLLASGAEGARLCVETLDYPLEVIEDLIADRGLSVCVDVGHLIVNDCDVVECLEHFAPRCRVVHLHGVRGDRDHCEIGALPPGVVEAAVRTLSGEGAAERVLTLEVFSREAFDSSTQTLARLTKAD